MVRKTNKRLGTKWMLAAMALAMAAGGCAPAQRSERAVGYVSAPNKAVQKAARLTGEPSKMVSSVYTTQRKLALTFNGMADSKTMRLLLDELDKVHIKATFFLPGMRVAEEPNLAKEILARGHEIENNTLNQLDLTKLDYDQIDKEIKLGKEVIQQKTGITPRYVRTWAAKASNDIRAAAAQNGQEAVITASLFLHNWENETEEQKYRYIRKYINRGGIIAMDTVESKQLLPNLALIAKAAADAGYQFATLRDLIAVGSKKKPLEQIDGYDAAKINADYDRAAYRLVTHMDTGKKEIALTFDDWGTDYTITKILDTLDKYDVKASFFLRADGVERNPNLARAIAEGGHDVANHTYSHPVNTKITQEQLQEEIVKAHRIITEAIQKKPTMYFRPPTGEFSQATLKAIGATGYHTVANFDVDPSDYDKSKSADDIVNAILKQTHSGSIILMHMLDDIHTAEALPIVIEKLRSQGYTFVKLSDMLGP